ncbi:NAD(P)/FAD-dependent oxidoreductase [Luteococcus sanguinis]|uniref:NADH:ubiquinone reductase (non-electrogenic) n=1 Tax=Luteococcus sanguinis TaxID=174038 RepID=A0ABW1WZX6_9ACTN
MSRPRVVIIGSGFGGLFSAKALADADVDIILVAKTTHHLFQPLLYQVATGILSPGEIAPPTREILKDQKNVTVLLSEVTAIDVENKKVEAEALGTVSSISYDYLIVAAGAGQSYFGNDHFAVFAPGMKSIDDALELRARIFGSLEVAELTSDQEERERLMTFVVVGAGPTGVEMAGQIRELTLHTVKDDYRRIDPRKARVILLDGADRVLPPFGEHLSGKAKQTLEKLGVEVKLGGLVTDVDANGLTVKYKDGTEERIEAACKVWAAGVQASPLAKMIADQTEAQIDRAGRLEVQPDCSVPGHPEVFVIGDMMSLDKLPGVAQVAIQSGQYVAKKIVGEVKGQPVVTPFKYFDKGSMAVISKFGAVVKIGRIEMTGFVAWLAWLGLHLVTLTGFKARITTLAHWTIAFVSNARSERVTTRQQLVSRLAVKQLGDAYQPTITGTLDPTVLDERVDARNRRDTRPQEI